MKRGRQRAQKNGDSLLDALPPCISTLNFNPLTSDA